MKSNEMAIYEYNGNPISFDKIEKGYMINATQMAKPFGKNVRQWFDNHVTHEYIEAVAADKGIEPMGKFRTSLNASDLAKRYPMLVKVSKGGMPGQVVQGTWMHEDVALEFARWLSPKFAIWCNNRIKELLLTGSTVIDRYDRNKREFPRAFSRNGLGRLHADNFKYGEIFFYSGDLLDLLGITLNSERNALVQKFGDQSFTRMEGPDGRIYFSERGTFAFLVERFNEKSHQVINWIFTEIIPTLRGESAVHKTSVSASSLRPFHQEESLFRLLDIACQVPDRELRERLRETILQMKTQSSIDTIN